MSDEEPPPRPRYPWQELERFRSARAFSQGGCTLPALLVVALIGRFL